MSTQRKLIIHIGSHKTGTTSIQQSLFLNRNALERHGFTLFNRGPDGVDRPSGNALTWIKFRLSKQFRVQGKIHNGLVPALAAAGENVIVSAETFSWVFNPAYIKAFEAQLRKHFDEIIIVSYLRRQDLQAVSQYQQSSKPGAIVASRFYGAGCTALPLYQPHFNAYLDYHQRLGYWGDTFGDNNLLLRIFQGDQLKHSDVVEDFYDTIGITREIDSGERNLSSGFERTKVGHLMSNTEYPVHLWKRVESHLDSSGKMLPARDEAEAFYQHFRASNENLRLRFFPDREQAVFSEDFAKYPQIATDRWTEDSANRAIGNLLNALEDITSIEVGDLNVLSDCALALEDHKPELAMELKNVRDRLTGDCDSGVSLRMRFQRALRRYLRS